MPTLIDSPKLPLTNAARKLGLHVATLYRWTSTGCKGRVLPSLTIGGRKYVLVADLERWLEDGREHEEHSRVPSRFHKRADDAGAELDRLGC